MCAAISLFRHGGTKMNPQTIKAIIEGVTVIANLLVDEFGKKK